MGRSQLPALAVVLENGRREVDPSLKGNGLLEDEGRAVQSGRRGLELIESFSNWAAKLEMFRGFMTVELLAAEVKLRRNLEDLEL